MGAILPWPSNPVKSKPHFGPGQGRGQNRAQGHNRVRFPGRAHSRGFLKRNPARTTRHASLPNPKQNPGRAPRVFSSKHRSSMTRTILFKPRQVPHWSAPSPMILPQGKPERTNSLQGACGLRAHSKAAKLTLDDRATDRQRPLPIALSGLW